MPDLTGKRVLLLGAETDLGAAIAHALADAGARLAVIAASSDAETAFKVQRLAHRLSTPERPVIAQAIEATNEAAVRVMVRQVSKEVSGLDAGVALMGPGRQLAFFVRHAGRELSKLGGVLVAPGVEPEDQPVEEMRPGFLFISFPLLDLPQDEYVRWVLHAIAGERLSG